MADAAAVSCLVVTRAARVKVLPRALRGFARQTWPNRELVIVHDGGDALQRTIEQLAGEHPGCDIRVHAEPPGRPLGALRNASVEQARGVFVCQWDDDDLYHPERLERQARCLLEARAQFCFLTDQMHLFADRGEMYWDDWTIETPPGHLIPGTLFGLRECLPRYPELARGEDTPLVFDLVRRGCRIAELRGAGWLYVYVYDGHNVFDRTHHERISTLKQQRREALLAGGLELLTQLRKHEWPVPTVYLPCAEGGRLPVVAPAVGGTIPPVIHHTWRTADVPPHWRPLMESWRRHHPHWTHRLWTDEDNQRLVDEHYPDLSAQYAACRHGIQRADIARCLILHRHGGVYVDLDVECLRPLDGLISGGTCVTVAEPPQHAAWMGQPTTISNAFLAASPGHPLLAAAIERLHGRGMDARLPADVLRTTGPVLLTEALADCATADVMLLPADALSPLTGNSEALARLRDGAADAGAIRADCLRRGAWGVHYWSNAWARGLAGTLINPDPHGVPGYVFHPGMDSPGFDLRNGGRDIARLAAQCDADGCAAGFNTDGFVKALIQPRSHWMPMPYVAADQGLYVKRAFHFGGGPGVGAPGTGAIAVPPSSRDTD